MEQIFISYGDKFFSKSLKQLLRQAKSSKRFDKVIGYRPTDLPSAITSSPLFLFKKGGGYWIWKPYIIYNALQQCEEGDVVYYADAGCTLNVNSEEWDTFKNEIQTHTAIFFQYRSNVLYDGWDKYCKKTSNNSPKILHWIKPATAMYFTEYFGNQDFLQYNKIWGGSFIIKKTPQILYFIEQWLKISIFHPELICDPYGKELSNIPESFNEHRHDQAILTPLLYRFKDDFNILIMPESSESEKNNAAIVASRRIIWTWNLFDKIAFRTRRISKYLLK